MLNTERAKLIQEYIDQNQDSKTGEKLRVPIKGKAELLEVYRLPIRLLLYSIRNGRFRAELLQKEAELGREIQETDEDMKIIRQLLITQNENETEALKKSLTELGQLQPGIITSDGYVINGNRRMSVLQSLDEATHNQKYQFIEMARLPQGVDQQDLWRIEAGIQLSKEDKLEYGAINERLKIKEGFDKGIKAEEIASTLMGRYSLKQVRNRLEELDLIDEYLGLLGKPKQYHLVEKRAEAFVDFRNGLENLKKMEKDDETISAYVMTFYNLILEETTHWKIRDLNSMFKKPTQAAQMLRDFVKENKREFSVLSKQSAAKIVDKFDDASEVYDAEQDVQKPVKLIRKSYNALLPLKDSDPKLQREDVRAELQKLWKRVYKLMKATGTAET